MESFRPFNYSIRKIQAALTVVPDLEVEVLDVYSDDLDSLEAEVERRDPDLIGASVYVWSLPTLYELARRLKRNRPDRIIVFGGPSARPAMLAQQPFRDAVSFVDALVLGEGEEIVRDLARLVASGAARERLREIGGLAVPVDGRWITTGERSRVLDLDALLSPYQLGLVPQHVTAHLESFRGCPFSCTFCEWGILGKASPVFSTEYLTRELEAMRAAGAIGAFSIDAALNLNARAFRNLKAAIERTGVFREIDFYCELYPSHFENEHVELLAGMSAAEVGIGIQSFDPEVLKQVERPFDPDRFDGILEKVAGVASPRLLIIIGLPGDNPRSFRSTLERCLSYGFTVQISHCLVLPDALMTRAPASFALDYDPISLRMRSCTGWTAEDFAREWDHLQELAAARGGYCLPHYFCELRATPTRLRRRPEESMPADRRAREAKRSRRPLTAATRALLGDLGEGVTVGEFSIEHVEETSPGSVRIELTRDTSSRVIEIVPHGLRPFRPPATVGDVDLFYESGSGEDSALAEATSRTLLDQIAARLRPTTP